jgi:hypothetical protein
MNQLPPVKRRFPPDIYEEQVNLSNRMPVIQPQIMAQPLPDINLDPMQYADQFRGQQTELPPDPREMEDYDLMQRATQDAKAAGVGQMTPEKRAHWARRDNEFAAERIRRKEQKEAEKKKENIIQGTMQYVEMGIFTPEKAVQALKAKGIDLSEEEMAKSLPAIRTPQTPKNVMTQDEYSAMKANQAYAKRLAEEGLPPDVPPDVFEEILQNRAETEKTKAEARRIGLPPIASEKEQAETDKIRRETDLLGTQPEHGKPSFTDAQIMQELRDSLGRDPTAEEFNSKKQELEKQKIELTGEARGRAYGASRLTTVYNPDNGEIETMNVNEFNERVASGENLTDQRTAAPLVARKAVLNEMRGSAQIFGDALEKMPEFSAKQRAQIAIALNQDDRKSATSAFFKSSIGQRLSQEQMEYIVTLQNLMESVAAMRGSGSDLLRSVIWNMIPSGTTPTKPMAKMYLKNLLLELDRMERGIAKIGLPPEDDTETDLARMSELEAKESQ